MATKPLAKNTISGTHGYLYWDSECIYEVSKWEIKLKTNRETIGFAGEMWDDSKLMGISGTWSMTIKKVFSRAAALAEDIAAANDPRVTFVSALDDPDALGEERVQISNAWFDELTIMSFEHGKTIDDELSGGYTGLKYLDKISKSK